MTDDALPIAPATPLEAIERLRRVADGAATSDDNAWLRAGIRQCVDGSTGGSLDQALGIAPRRGHRGWREQEAMRRRDDALRNWRDMLPRDKSLADILTLIRRYASAGYLRDKSLATMPPAYYGLPAEWLYRAFKAAGGRVPSSEKQLHRILSAGTSDDPF